MRNIPVDTTGLTFLVGSAPEASLERDSGRAKTNANGVPLWQLRLMVIDAASNDADVIAVKVASPTSPAVSVGQPVTPTRLTVNHWENNGRTGLAWRADTLDAKGAAKP